MKKLSFMKRLLAPIGLIAIMISVITYGLLFHQTPSPDLSQTVVLVERLDKKGKVDGFGSGVVISKDGHILTNRHVVRNTHSIRVTFKNGIQRKARLIWAAHLKEKPGYKRFANDVALLKVSYPNPFPYARLSCKLPKVGDQVSMIGHPIGLKWTTTWGRVAAFREGLIQMNGSIAPGNSGGALFNEDGKLIGLPVGIARVGYQLLPTYSFAVSGQTICSHLLRD